MAVEVDSPEQLHRRLQVRLAHYLRATGGDEIRDLRLGRLEQPSGGQSNETVLFDAEWSAGGELHRKGLVLRLQPDKNRMFLDTNVVTEGRLIEELARSSSVPVAPVLAVEADPRVLGRPFFLMERVAGHVPGGRPSIHRDPWLVSLGPAQRAQVCLNGLAALAAVHNSDWRRLPLAAPAGLDRELTELERWYQWASSGTTHELIEAGLKALASPPRPAAEAVLLWGDPRPGNIIFGDDQSVAAVIDWELAAVGQREADVGWWLMMDEFAERGAYGRTLEGMLSRPETVERYCALTGSRLGDLSYFVLLASVRLAITLLPSARSLAERGIIGPGSRFAHDNVPTQMIARHLGLAEPELSLDYRRLSRMGDPDAAR